MIPYVSRWLSKLCGLPVLSSQLQQHVTSLRAEIAELRTEAAILRTEASVLRGEVNLWAPPPDPPSSAIDETCARLASQIAILRSDHQALENALAAENMILRRDMLRQREMLALRSEREDRSNVRLQPVRKSYLLDECFVQLERAAPRAFSVWKMLLDANAAAYQGFPTHSCSVSGHPMAQLFGSFLRPYLRGAVLDIGCGPQPVPVYLKGYPLHLIAGIDPLSDAQSHPFFFVKGVAEYIPWPDESFDVIVVGTSLDHVLLLDKVLEEVQRVLRPGGHLILWLGFVENAKPYDPYAKDVQAIDQYHLFHFDRPWFEELMLERFVPVESFSFIPPNVTSFYSYRPRKADSVATTAITKSSQAA